MPALQHRQHVLHGRLHVCQDGMLQCRMCGNVLHKHLRTCQMAKWWLDRRDASCMGINLLGLAL